MKQIRQFCRPVARGLERFFDPRHFCWYLSTLWVLAIDAVMWSLYSHHYQWLIWLTSVLHSKDISIPKIESQAKALGSIPMSEFAWDMTLISVRYLAFSYLVIGLAIALGKLFYKCFNKIKSDFASDPGTYWFLADLLVHLVPAKEREQIVLDNDLREMIDRYGHNPRGIMKAKCIVLTRVLESLLPNWINLVLRVLEAWRKLGG